MPSRDMDEAETDIPGTHGRLGSQPQSVPMPRGGYEGVRHPELIRNVDGRTLWSRNTATPFGDNPDPEPDGDDDSFESGF